VTRPLAAPPPRHGATVPRLFTPPLVTGAPGPCGCGCALQPDTSDGFQLIDWAENVMGTPPRPWQRWAAIHGLELLPDRRPRFRILLVEAGRQNGKTWLPQTLASWWLFACQVPLVLGTSAKLDYARESWDRMCAAVEAADALTDLRGRRWRRDANGEQQCWTTERARYKIAPANAEGGRSLTVYRLILDELRQHHDYQAWSASVYAGNAVPTFQAWALSNAGTAASIVLNNLHDQCAEFIRTGAGDPRTGMFSWSCPVDADPTDPLALLQANPSAGYGGPDLDLLVQQGAAALAAGGPQLTEYRTEVMCIRTAAADPAVNAAAWAASCHPAGVPAGAELAACLDVAPDGAHACLVVACHDTVEDRPVVRVEVVAAWTDLAVLRAELPDWITRVRPAVLGWFPAGPAAAVDVELRAGRRRGWPPRGIAVQPVTAQVPAVCVGFAALVAAQGLAHSGQDLLDAQVQAAEKRDRGDAWVFDRRAGGVHIDAVYAAAGAVHLLRSRPQRRRASGLHLVGDD